MPVLPERLEEFLEEIESFDRAERTEVLLDFSDRFAEVPDRIATRPFPEEHRVQRCESEAYVWSESDDSERLKFYFAVENPQGVSARSLAMILDKMLSGQPVDQVAAVPQDVVYRIFGKELSLGKGQGLMGMLSMVTAEAKALLRNG